MSTTYPSFKSFLITENDVESTPGETLDAELTPVQQADDLAGLDADPEAAGEPLDVDSDERFLDLSPVEQRRIRIYARNMSPPEVEEELQTTWERTSGAQGGAFGTDDLAGIDADLDAVEASDDAAGAEAGEMADDDMSSSDEFAVDGEDDYQMADNRTAMPKRMAPQSPMGESFLQSLLRR